MKKLVLLFLVFFYFQSLQCQNKVAVYWDASYSMKDRKLERELKFLDNYFKKYSDSDVILVMFSNDIFLRESYEIRSGDWSALQKELIQTVYDGGTSYTSLFTESVNEYLLFTDGIENFGQLDPPVDKPIHIITTVEGAKMSRLKLISDLSSGLFVYLNTSPLTKPNVVEKKEEIVSGKFSGIVTGNIFGVEGNLPNVSVVNQNSQAGTASNSQGNYSIKAKEGDILIFSFLGKKTVSIRVNKADIINITMSNIEEALDEVVLTVEAEKEDRVNTGNQTVDKKTLGYAVETITSDDISDIDTDLIGAVKGQFSNFEIPNDVYNKADISHFLGRGKNMSILLNQYGLIVVDGVPLSQSSSGFGGIQYNQDDIINPEMIHSITYLKGLAATNKYGTFGRNGVLLITTKNAISGQTNTDGKANEIIGTTDTYSGNAEMINSLPNTPYISALKTATSVNEAFKIYLEQREKYSNDPVFYMDVHDYFKGWNNALIMNRILSNIYEININDPILMKVVAFKQQEKGLFDDALKTYEHILKLLPNHSQSYRDLALAHVYSGNYQEALSIYNRIDGNRNVGNSNFAGIRRTMLNEAKNLIAIHGNQMNTAGTNSSYLKPIKYKSRIVFEWNHLDAEFDLNIINPQNRFFTWSHTNAENSQNIIQEKQQGFGVEEFYLTKDDIGEWKFNVKYYGNGTDQPTYIKITTYKNFGSANQTKEIKVVRLGKTNVEQTVSNLMVSN